MSDHLSTQLLESYSRRRLSAAELLALDDHFSSCADCRDQFRQLNPRPAALLALRSSLQVADEAEPTHLPHEQLLAYTMGRLEAVDRELAESHLEVCLMCAAEVPKSRDLFVQQDSTVDTFSPSVDLRSLPRPLWTRLAARLSLSSLRSRVLPPPLTLRMAVAAAGAALLVIGVAVWLRPQKDGREIIGRSGSASPSPSQSPVSLPPGPQQAAQATILLALNDGGGQITLDQQGNLTGLELLSPADQQRVKAALETQKVRTPKTSVELRGSSGAIMGKSNETDLAPISPVGKVVASDRPTFHWRPLAGAISYQVTITDPAAGYKEVAASPPLQEINWTVARPLERGRVYNWQITGRTSGGEVKAPAANAPEAKFKVLEKAIADELARAKKAYAGRRLILGVLYAEAGLLEEAERELRALARANPQSAVAKNLLGDVRSKQR